MFLFGADVTRECGKSLLVFFRSTRGLLKIFHSFANVPRSWNFETDSSHQISNMLKYA